MIFSRSRSNFVIKASNFRSIITFHVDKFLFFQFFQFHMLANFFVIEQFQIHRFDWDSCFLFVENENEEKNEKIRRRILYIRRQKLKIVNYATIIWKIQKNRLSQFINKCTAVKNFEISSTILCKWMKKKSKIEITAKKTRKNRLINVDYQQPKIENRLMQLFVETKKIRKKIINRWISGQSKNIYEQLHFNRVIKWSEKSVECFNFKFSNDWFRSFKKRHNINVRMFTKKFQTISFFYWIF